MKLRVLTAISIMLVSPILASAVQAGGSPFKITDPNLGHQLFTDALNAKDLERLVAMYADDAVMVAPGNRIIRGKKDIRAFFVKTVKSVEKIKLDTVFRINYKDIVVFRSRYTVTYRTPEGKRVTQSTSGIEVEQKQKDGRWLFIVDHHYGGADFEDFLQLNSPS